MNNAPILNIPESGRPLTPAPEPCARCGRTHMGLEWWTDWRPLGGGLLCTNCQVDLGHLKPGTGGHEARTEEDFVREAIAEVHRGRS